jgi:large subunit ribosomal protein L37Ae
VGKTKKVDVAGKYGSRYGVGIRRRLLKVSVRQKDLGPCPACGFSRVKRVAAGLFTCTKCGIRFTGGAYEIETLPGKAVRKAVSQKSFVFGTLDISKLKESSFADIEREVEKVLTQEGAAGFAEEKAEKRSADSREKEPRNRKKEGGRKTAKEKGKKKGSDFDDF